MNLYTYFYCRAFDWYNTNGKKDKDTLRISAISLISGFMAFNILSIVVSISLVMRKTPINKWEGLLIAVALLTYNFLRISSKRSETLRNEYALVPERQNNRLKVMLTIYMVVSLIVFVSLMGLIAYVKTKYGNYDKP